jgi:hypothetical protein
MRSKSARAEISILDAGYDDPPVLPADGERVDDLAYPAACAVVVTEREELPIAVTIANEPPDIETLV